MKSEKNYLRNLILGSSLSLVILLSVSILSWLAVRSMLAAQEQIRHTQEVRLGLENIGGLLKDAETGQRGYLLTKRTNFLEPYNTAKAQLWKQYDDLGILVNDDPEQRKDWDRMNDIIKQRMDLLEKNISSVGANVPLDAALLIKGKYEMDRLRGIIGDMQTRESQLLDTRISLFGFYSTYVPWLIILASVIASAVTILFYRRLKKGVLKRAELEEDLKVKSEALNRRMKKIEEISSDISSGNYHRRIDEKDLS